MEREGYNIKRAGTLALSVGGGLAVAGPLAWAAAPAVGGAIGTGYFGLQGAAAVSKGLATLGLGALNGGGFGMAGGTAIVTAVGAALGGQTSGALAQAYLQDLDFHIEKVTGGTGPTVIAINGFLTEGADIQMKPWLNVLKQRFPDNPWYLLHWESQNLKKIGSMATPVSSNGLKMAIKKAAERATKGAAAKLSPVGHVLTMASLARNPWHVAWIRSAQTGAVLADIMARTDRRRRYILVGHSLGARVIAHVLQALGDRSPQLVKSAHLLGGAVDSENAEYWDNLSQAVTDEIHNYYSDRDFVLKYLYDAGKFFFGTPAVGRVPIPSNAPNIVNHDVSDVVGGHNMYKENAHDFFH
jgi:hypothetical protein